MRIEEIGKVPRSGPAARNGRGSVRQGTGGFGSMLQQQIRSKESGGIREAPETREIREAPAIGFSKHALARAEERGIELTPDLMDRLAGSVEKAQEKGARHILAFDSARAFIIDTSYARVITTMSQEEMRENIFTNIDGAVLL